MLRNFALLFSFCLVAVAHGAYYVGSGASYMDVPVGVPLGGYGGAKRRSLFKKFKYAKGFKPSTGYKDSLRSKAFLLEDKSRAKSLVVISSDLIGIHSYVVEDLRNRLKAKGLRNLELVVTATHTHSGPATLSKQRFWQVIAMDRYKDVVYQWILDSMERAVLRAYNARREARLKTMTFSAAGLTKNRRDGETLVDDQVRVIFAEDLKGKILGVLLNFAIHGTAWGASNLEFSHDVPGAIENAIEKELLKISPLHRPKVLHLNASLGDVKPIKGKDEGMKMISSSMKTRFMAALSTSRVMMPNWSFKSSEVVLGKAKMKAKACDLSPLLLFGPFAYLNSLVKKAFPKKISIRALIWGDMAIMLWPGEPTSDLGLKAMAGIKLKYPQSMVVSLSDDHFGYFMTKDQYKNGGYEACMSPYGVVDGGDKVREAFISLLR